MNSKPTVWPVLVYSDAPSAIRFLVDALGFEERLVVPGGDDPVVSHAEFVWPEGGGVMLHGADRDDSVFSRKPIGAASVYVVTDHPDEVHDRAVAAKQSWSNRCRTKTTGPVGSRSPTRRGISGALARTGESDRAR